MISRMRLWKTVRFIGPYLLVSLVLLGFLLVRYGPVDCYSLRPEHQCVCIAMEGYYAEKREKQFEEAVNYYTEAINMCPDAPYYYYRRAQLHIRNNDIDSALSDFDSALKSSDDTSVFYKYYIGRAELLTVRGEYEKAVPDYQQAHGIFPAREEPVQALAKISLDEKDYESAARWYGTLISLEPENASAYAERGYAYHMTGRFADALRDYDRALELMPSLEDVQGLRSLARDGQMPAG
ncbi:MAG: tetratricopeptide repeat protein [Proteobacteria bacterium]|nr:tetratricopeptide repeat protein [Pseudomonadota bacterium]